MYAQVYNHPKNVAATWVLDRAFHRAKALLAQQQLAADETVSAWLTQDCNQLSLQHYLNADDGVFFYHLQRWQQHCDPILADLCRRFVDRDLLKALDISHLSPARQQQFLQTVRQNLPPHLSPSDYAGLRTTLSRGYTLYQRGIKLAVNTGLQEISQRSPLIQTLTQPWQRSWLLYPREIDPTPFMETMAEKNA
jgi:HD superfamily phosphohydrolase